MKHIKICVGASAGGHMNELLKLIENMENWTVKPSVFITTQQLLADKLNRYGKTYIIGECNRKHPFSAVAIFFRGMKIIRAERPDVIITTGSLPIAIVCLVAKLFGKKVVWIDSIANITELSMSGRMMYRFADLFLTQWEGLTEKYRKAEYVGQIL